MSDVETDEIDISPRWKPTRRAYLVPALILTASIVILAMCRSNTMKAVGVNLLALSVVISVVILARRGSRIGGGW